MVKPNIISGNGKERPSSKFRPFISAMRDLTGAFSIVPNKVVCKEDIFSYIHVSLEEYDHIKLDDFKRIQLVDGA